MNQVADQWLDYECIDAGNGEKLERWKDIILRRPDPQVSGLLIQKTACGKTLMPIIIEVKVAEAIGSIRKSLKKAGRFHLRNFVSKFHLPDLNIPDYFQNKLPTGIL